MRTHRLLAISSVGALLAACQPNGSAPGDPGAAIETPDLCHASKARIFVGKIDSAANRAGVIAATMAENIRWLTPGMAATMDFRPDRLNARIDEAGKYTGFDCG